MMLGFKINKVFFCLLIALICFNLGNAQGPQKSVFAQIALGVNSPSSDGFVADFESKTVNFPTLDLGLLYMFKPALGAKLGYSFSRFSNEDETPEFKVNYSRINALLVYDANKVLRFLPQRMGVFLQAGPGFTMIDPLGDYPENNTSYFNVLGGLQLHYGLSDTLSVYADVSYTNGFSKDFDPITEGYGSFNGNLLAITFGASIALDGCYFCN